MQTYTVKTAFRTPDGRNLKPGDSVAMTRRQAKYLLLSAKLSSEPAKPEKPKASPVKTKKE